MSKHLFDEERFKVLVRGDSFLDLELLFDSEIRRNVKEALDEVFIELPFDEKKWNDYFLKRITQIKKDKGIE